MEYINLSNINKKASRIGLGTWAMGGSLWGTTVESESINTILRGLDIGITFIDTAPGYGFGLSEEVVGKAIKLSGKRDDVIIATKCGLNLKDPSNVFRDSRKEAIKGELEESLKRLQVDYIDLYQVHWPDPFVLQEDVASVLFDLLKEGKIRSIGVSNYSIDQIKILREFAPLSSVQEPYNLFERDAEPVIKYAKENKMAVIGYSSLCRGLLTGQLKEDYEFEDLRKNFDPKFKKPYFSQYLICVGRLEQWALDKYKRSLTATAIRWSLDKGVDIALWGARTPKELDPTADILGWKFNQLDLGEMDQIIKETIINSIGPQFMSPPLGKHKEEK